MRDHDTVISSSRRFARTGALAGLAASFLMLTAGPVLAQGCAMCGTTVGADDPLGRGLAYSIAFMLAVPNLLVASIGGWIYYMYRRAGRTGKGGADSANNPGGGAS